MLTSQSSLPLTLPDESVVSVRITVSGRAKRMRLTCGISGVAMVVPHSSTQDEILSFLAGKRSWIGRTNSHYERLRQKCGGWSENTVFYLGERYQMRTTKDSQNIVVVSDSMRVITFHVPDVRRHADAIREWYREETARIIGARLPQMAAAMGIKYGRVSIKHVTSRWGSCSRKGNLTFNLLLAAAPPSVTDYVIVHELAHLKRMDHSPAFWQIVQSADPEYKKHRAWLADYAPVLNIR